MTTYDYPDDCILLVAESDILRVQKKLLKQGSKGVEITTLKRFIQQLDRSNIVPSTLLFECYHRFKPLQSHLHYFKDSVLSFTFIQECLTFLDQLHFYSISAASLPEHSKSACELKMLFEHIDDLKTEATILHENLTHLPDNLSHVIIDIPTPSFQEEKLIQILLAHHAKQMPFTFTTPDFEYYYANNPRCELEAIAQKIIREHMDLQDVMVACCSQQSLSIAKSVFDRYHLPTYSHTSHSSSTAFQSAALLEFALNPTYQTFYDCLIQHCFHDQSALIQAQQIYPYAYDQPYPNFTQESFQSELFSSYEITQLIHIIEQANKQKKILFPYCQRLAHADSIQNILYAVDEIMTAFHQPSAEFVTMMRKIQALFVDALPYLHEKEDLRFLIDQIKRLSISQKNNRLDCISLLPYEQLSTCLPITFVCHATQTNFSDFHSMNGIFDENYVAHLAAFPSLMTRYQHHHHQITNRLFTGKHVIISYSLSDYLGKAFESSLDIDYLLHQEPVPFAYQKSDVFVENIQSLTEAEASQLYLHHQTINGSVSSLEKYVGCPYAYFLRYGCHIQEPLEIGFNVQKIGTLNHAILEILIHNHGKDYVHATADEIAQIVDIYLHDMQLAFPHLIFDLIRDRLIESMKLNLVFLADMETASSLTPTYCEKQWHRQIPINDHMFLQLNGFVDRVDTSQTTFRILDYKSSQKKLEKDKVFSGQQLQLCTYLMQMSDELKLRPLGCFYYSLQNGKLSLPYEKLSRKTKITEEISESAIWNEFKRQKRLQGWIFDDNVALMDEDGSHTNGIRNTKSKGVYASQQLKIEELSDAMQEMMRLIASSIMSGDIRLEPNENACLFCKYRPICRFNGSFTEKKQLVDLPPCMKKEEDMYE